MLRPLRCRWRPPRAHSSREVYHIRVKKAEATAKAHGIKNYESLDAACSRVNDWVHEDCKVEIEVATGSMGKNLMWTSDPKGMYKELQEKHKKERKKEQKKQTARQEGNGSDESDGPSDQPPQSARLTSERRAQW